MPHRNLAVLDAAEKAADSINALLDKPRPGRLLHANQLRAAAQSVRANIAEGFGRGTKGDRGGDRSLVIANGETDEVIQHMRSNLRANRIDAAEYWPHHNRYVVIGKMVKALRHRPARGRRKPK